MKRVRVLEERCSNQNHRTFLENFVEKEKIDIPISNPNVEDFEGRKKQYPQKTALVSCLKLEKYKWKNSSNF